DISISTTEINRPGLQMAGYYEFFDADRIQIFGKSEQSFLDRFTEEKAEQRLRDFFSKKPSAVVIARNLEVGEMYVNTAKEYGVPLLRTADSTSDFTSALIAFLNLHLAPRVTRHGVLVEVYGEGILLLGESGVGKSETAIELVKRGHRLIADDAVEIRKVSNKSLVGTAPDNIRHFIELRGIGIINASRIFGAGAVKLTEKIDLVINIEPWDVNKVYDRMGLESQTTEILDLNIPSLTIPVKPGRNLAVIIEVAAMNSRQKKLGYNAAEDLLQKLGMMDDTPAPTVEKNVEPF
ncbi:MAG: HPr(Ser) kinase/phosphatase, partial [Clostridia bacterium]|nr:HPr(Ser) kinase/phosphatase [Clostridia bacterium]